MSGAVAWTPSSARTIALAEFAGSPRPGRETHPPQLRWPAKQPGDVLDYSLDISAWLADATDAPVRVTATPIAVTLADVAISQVVITGGLVTTWLTGGAPGTDYAINVTIETLAGRKVNADCLIYALAGLPAPSPPSNPPGPVVWAVQYGTDFRVASNLINGLLLF
jgi:hypothetical protein